MTLVNTKQTTGCAQPDTWMSSGSSVCHMALRTTLNKIQ